MSDGVAAAVRACMATLSRRGSGAGRFCPRFPSLNQRAGMLRWTWEALERQLESLADSPSKKRMVPPLVSATRKQAWCKPDEMVLREILLLAGLLQDGSFQPRPLERTGGGEEFPIG